VIIMWADGGPSIVEVKSGLVVGGDWSNPAYYQPLDRIKLFTRMQKKDSSAPVLRKTDGWYV
jgi:hypothetical protein